MLGAPVCPPQPLWPTGARSLQGGEYVCTQSWRPLSVAGLSPGQDRVGRHHVSLSGHPLRQWVSDSSGKGDHVAAHILLSHMQGGVPTLKLARTPPTRAGPAWAASGKPAQSRSGGSVSRRRGGQAGSLPFAHRHPRAPGGRSPAAGGTFRPRDGPALGEGRGCASGEGLSPGPGEQWGSLCAPQLLTRRKKQSRWVLASTDGSRPRPGGRDGVPTPRRARQVPGAGSRREGR